MHKIQKNHFNLHTIQYLIIECVSKRSKNGWEERITEQEKTMLMTFSYSSSRTGLLATAQL